MLASPRRPGCARRLDMSYDPMTKSRSNSALRVRATKSGWALSNGRCRLFVSGEDGSFARLALASRRGEVDVWRGRTGGVVVYDELREREFSDASSRVTVLDARVDRESGRRVVLSMRKKYRGADFVVEQRVTLEPDNIRFDLDAHKTRGRDRSIQVKFVFPFPLLPSDHLCEQYNQDEGFHAWMLWAPTLDAPFRKGFQSDTQRQDFVYNLGGGRGGVTVPVISVYAPEPDVDVGYSLASPLEVYKPKLVFEIERPFGEESFIPIEGRIAVSTYCLGLRAGRAARAAVFLTPHEGDWRPGLRWFRDRYAEYFRPTDPKIFEQEGVMMYALPCWPEAKIKEFTRDMGLRWQEVRYEARFGDYIPETEPWNEDAWKTAAHPERELKGLTYKRINDYLALLSRHGVSGFAYFQMGGDIERRFCKERGFEEYVIRRKDGSLFPGCAYPDGVRKTWLINPLPGSRWERHILDQAERLFDTYPLMAGLFVDQLCYRFWDYSRDDGMTMVNNRPVYNCHLSLIPILEKLHAILKRRGKTTFGNGPTTIEAQRHIDGIMAEHRLDFLASQAHVALAKPLVMLTQAVSDFKWCLKYGAFPHTLPDYNRWPNGRKRRAEHARAFKAYLPLFELMRGRRWVLAAHALTLPDGMDGNIFRTPAGDYLIPLIPKEPDLDTAGLIVRTRLADAAKIKSARFMGVEGPRRRTLRFTRKGRDISIVLPRGVGIGVTVLKR